MKGSFLLVALGIPAIPPLAGLPAAQNPTPVSSPRIKPRPATKGALKAKAVTSKPVPKARARGVSVLKSPQDPDRKAENEVINGMLRRGCDAQARGDYALAERSFQDAAARERNDYSLPRLHLAWLYDLMGRDRDALTQYRTLLRAEPECEKPEILARYGELCLEFGDRNEARAAYVAAITQSTYGTSHLEPRIAPRNASFDAVRAAALLAWAMKSGSIGDTKTQTARLEAAERIDPANWTVRFYRARELSRAQRREEAQAEADKALSLAPRSSRAQIIEMMDVRGLRLP